MRFNLFFLAELNFAFDILIVSLFFRNRAQILCFIYCSKLFTDCVHFHLLNFQPKYGFFFELPTTNLIFVGGTRFIYEIGWSTNFSYIVGENRLKNKSLSWSALRNIAFPLNADHNNVQVQWTTEIARSVFEF